MRPKCWACYDEWRLEIIYSARLHSATFTQHQLQVLRRAVVTPVCQRHAIHYSCALHCKVPYLRVSTDTNLLTHLTTPSDKLPRQSYTRKSILNCLESFLRFKGALRIFHIALTNPPAMLLDIANRYLLSYYLNLLS